MELWNFPWHAWTRKIRLRKSHYRLKFGGMTQFAMKRITVWNGHTQPMSAFSDLGQPRVLPFSERLVLQWCNFTSSGDESTSSGDDSIIRTASNAIKRYDTKLHFIWNSQLTHIPNMRDWNPKSRIYTDGFPRRSMRSGRSNYFNFNDLGTYVLFVEQSVVSLSLYIIRQFGGR